MTNDLDERQSVIDDMIRKALSDAGLELGPNEDGFPDGKFIRMPDYIHNYNGSGTPCDMLRGPCACGATHMGELDWLLKDRTPELLALAKRVVDAKTNNETPEEWAERLASELVSVEMPYCHWCETRHDGERNVDGKFCPGPLLKPVGY